MCPVRWSLKNQWTAPAVPVADILRCVGIGVCVVSAAWTEKCVLFPRAECAAMMTALARIGRRHLLNSHTSQVGFVGDILFQLEERPIVPVLPCVRFRGLALSAALTDTRQVFETDASVISLRQGYDPLARP